jgi:hypothetical protein
MKCENEECRLSPQLATAVGDRAAAFDCCNRLGVAYLRSGDAIRAAERLRRGVGGPDLTERDLPGRVVGLTRRVPPGPFFSVICSLMVV